MNMPDELSLVIFALDEQRYALPCKDVVHIFQAAYISPVPNTQNNILGLINVEGDIISVINIRQQLGLANKDMSVDDFIIITNHSNENTIGFVVNDVDFISVEKHEIENSKPKVNGFVKVIKTSRGILYLMDMNSLITNKSSKSLNNMQHVNDVNSANNGV